MQKFQPNLELEEKILELIDLNAKGEITQSDLQGLVAMLASEYKKV